MHQVLPNAHIATPQFNPRPDGSAPNEEIHLGGVNPAFPTAESCTGFSSAMLMANSLISATPEQIARGIYPPLPRVISLRLTGSEPRLPPRSQMKRIFEAHLSFVGQIFTFMTMNIFEQRLEQILSHPLDMGSLDSRLHWSQVLLVIAFGLLFSINQWAGNDGPPGIDYFRYALQILPAQHDGPSTQFVEVLGYVGYYLQTLNKRDEAYLYVGMALRMAIAIGLNEISHYLDLSPIPKEHHRRLWWSIYGLDR